jgi:hypothetical protein
MTRPLRNRLGNCADWGRLPKSLKMAGIGMPQLYGREIATGELAQVTGDTG